MLHVQEQYDRESRIQVSNFKDTPIIELAAIVANHLQQHGIEVVLVGGLAVEIYTENLYLTNDIDLVNTSYTHPRVMNKAMTEMGFTKQGRVYVNESTDICVEFPTAPLGIGDELIKETTVIDLPCGQIPILLASDVIKDRLAAYFHWQDKPSLVQALAVMINHSIEPDDLKSFCEREGEPEEYIFIKKLHQATEQQQLTTMIDIEKKVLKEIIQKL